MPPKGVLDVAQSSVRSVAILVAESHDCALSLPAPTKIWQKDYRDPHERAAVHPVRDSKNKSGKGRYAKLSA